MLATLVVILIAAIGGWFVLKAQHEERVERERKIVVAQDRLRSLATFMIVRATEKGWSSAPYNGKAFVLAALARGDLDRRRRENLTIFWSPALDEEFAAMDIGRYAEVTKAALEAHRDLSAFTSHAGRLNGPQPCAITSEMQDKGVPILADAQIPGTVVIAFTTGRVKAYDYAELGLPEDGPVVFGPDSPAELLRCLSDK